MLASEVGTGVLADLANVAFHNSKLAKEFGSFLLYQIIMQFGLLSCFLFLKTKTNKSLFFFHDSPWMWPVYISDYFVHMSVNSVFGDYTHNSLPVFPVISSKQMLWMLDGNFDELRITRV